MKPTHLHRVLILILALLLIGCAGKRTHLFEEVRNNLRASQPQKAYSNYTDKIGDTERVDELLNLGLLALEAGDYAKAIGSFAEADRLAEDRLTKSLSREGAALVTSDRVRAYQGTVIDKAMLHYYSSLAYLAQDKPDDAVIEGRRIASYLEVNARESKHAYKDDAFLQWYSGSLYESYGQTNDAWISYTHALKLYKDFYGVPTPSFLCPVTLNAAQAVGHSASEERLENLCPDAAADLNPDWGRVVVLCEAGLAPPILENNIMFPIMKTERSRWKSKQDRGDYASTVYNRGHDYQYNNSELDYLLRVALPIYPKDFRGSQVGRITVRGDGISEPAELGTNIGAILRQDLRDRAPAITVRAITRALIKYAATKAAKEAGGEDKTKRWIFGAAMNLLGAATEAADTRSWETLPDRIYAADFQLPPGDHQLRALFEDNSGSVLLRHDFPTITIAPGEVVILRARCLK